MIELGLHVSLNSYFISNCSSYQTILYQFRHTTITLHAFYWLYTKLHKVDSWLGKYYPYIWQNLSFILPTNVVLNHWKLGFLRITSCQCYRRARLVGST